MFLGFTQLDEVFSFTHVCKFADVPVEPVGTPTYRIYSGSSPTPLLTGSLSQKDVGLITDATNAAPIVITASGHNLQTGMRVTITGVAGNPAANGTWVITRIDANTFSLDTSSGNGPYTTGGAWSVSGLYKAAFTPTMALGFAQGENYDIILTATLGVNVVVHQYRFGIN